jgi:hypothetical protein
MLFLPQPASCNSQWLSQTCKQQAPYAELLLNRRIRTVGYSARQQATAVSSSTALQTELNYTAAQLLPSHVVQGRNSPDIVSIALVWLRNCFALQHSNVVAFTRHVYQGNNGRPCCKLRATTAVTMIPSTAITISSNRA